MIPQFMHIGTHTWSEGNKTKFLFRTADSSQSKPIAFPINRDFQP